MLFSHSNIFDNKKDNISLVLSKYLMSGEQFRYPECTKGECHVGEVLNLVCLEPQCIQKSIICGICYDE